jgi:hypothetical protein
MIIRAKNAFDAFEIANKLKSKGEYNWFRGQPKNWPLVSSLHRLSKVKHQQALDRVVRFGGWVHATKGLEDLDKDPDMALAVAQHYGIKTSFIDFTTDIETAIYFATDKWKRHRSKEGVILCLNTDDLLSFWKYMPERFPAPECLTPSVRNLWRLEAQRGVFLLCPYTTFERIYELDRIVFPHAEACPSIPRQKIYPSRKSELELLLEQFFLLDQIHDWHRYVKSAFPKARTFTIESPGPYGDPELLGKVPPPELASWGARTLSSWRDPHNEKYHECQTDLSIDITSCLIATHSLANRTMLNRVLHAMRSVPNIRSKSVHFILNGKGQLPLCFLNHLWDGLRRLPYSDDLIATAMGNATALFTVHRKLSDPDEDNWEREIQICLGDFIQVEFSADDGSYSRGFVNRKQLLEAVRPDIGDYLCTKYKKRLIGNMTGLLQAVYVPNRLFDFGKLAVLFATQLAPVQVLARKPVVFFSPASLTGFGIP